MEVVEQKGKLRQTSFALAYQEKCEELKLEIEKSLRSGVRAHEPTGLQAANKQAKLQQHLMRDLLKAAKPKATLKTLNTAPSLEILFP